MPSERRRQPRSRPPAAGPLRLRAAEAARSPYDLGLRLVDLSDRGACVETAGRLRPGLRVVLDLPLPGTRLTVRVHGVVRWARSGPRDGRPGDFAGIQFERALMAAVEGAAPRKDPQRRHRRFVPGEADEVLCLPDDVWTGLGLRRNASRRLRDLSLGGAQMETHRPLRVHQAIRFRIVLPSPRLVIEGEGAVRWCRRDTLSLRPRWTVGIVFRRLRPGASSALQQLARYHVP